MALNALRDHLQHSFDGAAAAHFDALIELDIAGERLRFEVRHGEIRFLPADGTAADATFLFADVDTAWSLLSGRGDAFQAFMDGRFRSDGHLMWAFALMAMFRSTSLPEHPTE